MISREQYYDFLADDYIFSESNLNLLEECIEAYPFNEAFRYAYLKGWYYLNYAVFEQKLNQSAVFISKREALFCYIFEQELKNYQSKNKGCALDEDKTSFLIDVFFERLGEAQDDKLSIDNNNGLLATDYLAFLEEQDKKKNKKKKTTTTLVNDLIFVEPVKVEGEVIVKELAVVDVQESKNEDTKMDDGLITPKEVEDFRDVLSDIQTTSGEPLVSVYQLSDVDSLVDEGQQTESYPVLKHQNLIDDFLEKEYIPLHTLKREDLKNDKDYASEEVEQVNEESSGDNTFFTETLARIYIKQGRFEKAYEIIKHLSLKYPRKNVYFAEQLSYLEKLIINSKHNKK